MDKAQRHFYITYQLYRELVSNYTNISVNSQDRIINQEDFSINVGLLNSLNKENRQMLLEVFTIEKEKLQLRDSKEETQLIFEREHLNYKRAHKILSSNLNELNHLKFQLNPFVEIYESFWKWVHSELEKNFLPVKYWSNQIKGDYYFLLKRTGTFDVINDSNVMELPLTLFQYCLLQEFQQPKTYSSVKLEFKKKLNYSTKKEIEDFEISFSKIFKENIFKSNILQCGEF